MTAPLILREQPRPDTEAVFFRSIATREVLAGAALDRDGSPSWWSWQTKGRRMSAPSLEEAHSLAGADALRLVGGGR